MKTKELMIGHWVYFNEKVPMRVVGISGDDVCLKSNEGDVIRASIGSISPIPLTVDMLIRNGFKKVRIYASGVLRYCISVNKVNIEALSYKDSVRIETFYFAKVHQYVHQLQTILSLLDVDFEFKL